MLLYLVTAGLSLAAAVRPVLPGDVAVSRAVQSIDFQGVGRLERAGYFIGSFEGIVTLGIVIVAGLLLARRFADAGLLAGALVLRGTNPSIKGLIQSARPTDDLVRVAENATKDPGTFGFPSGHAMGTVLLFGGIIYLAQVHVRSTRLRIALQAVSLLLIFLVGWSRIYSGAHWITDTLGGVLWGLALLTPDPDSPAGHRNRQTFPRRTRHRSMIDRGYAPGRTTKIGSVE
ncbi:MAG: phosphatase PAP2 family protein [Thermomicrobiales bacterium]